MMPEVLARILFGIGAERKGLGGMAAEVRHQHMLKCFKQSNAMTALARVIGILIGGARFGDPCPVRRRIDHPSLIHLARRSRRSTIPAEFAC